MKCPYRLEIVQKTYKELETFANEHSREVLIVHTKQHMMDCPQEDCGAWLGMCQYAGNTPASPTGQGG